MNALPPKAEHISWNLVSTSKGENKNKIKTKKKVKLIYFFSPIVFQGRSSPPSNKNFRPPEAIAESQAQMSSVSV